MILRLILILSFVPHIETTCNIPLTSSLRDDQFSASSEYNSKYNASAARKDGEGWRAYLGGKYEYLKVDLESVFELSSLEVEGSSIGWYPRSFRISYSNDGYVWTGYNTRLSSDVMGELFLRQGAITKITFDPVIKARYVVINPVTYIGNASLRIELYGCRSSDKLPTIATNVQNGIEVNTTWIPSQSPILIHGSVAVRYPAVLTVQAGVKVIFTSPSASIHVYGTLSVEGIKGLSPLFSSNHPVLADRAKWRGISHGSGGRIYMNHALIRQAVTGLQGNGSSIKTANCEIHSCTDGIRLAGGVANNSDALKENAMILFNVNVHDNKDGVVTHAGISKPFITFAYSKFDLNDDNGILVKNWDNSDADFIVTNLLIINCSMSRNYGYGIQNSQGITSNINVTNSTFAENVRRGVYLYSYYSFYYSISHYSQLNIIHSYFVKNRQGGVKVYCRYCISSEHVFHDNIFNENGYAAVEIKLVMKTPGERTNVSISSNRFEHNDRRDIEIFIQNHVRADIINNYFAKSRMSVKLSGPSSSGTDFVNMYNNVFTEHTPYYYYSVIEVEGTTVTISNTTFANSSIPTLVKFKNGFDHTFEFNRFINVSLTRCFIRIDQNYDPNYSLKIDNNYWGTNEILKIKSKICDFFLDSNKAIANVSNFYSSATFETSVSTLDIDDFRFERSEEMNATIVGGIVRFDLDLSSLRDNRLIVNRSLLIAESANVTIKNVTVFFSGSRGIVAYGNLTIGDKQGPTNIGSVSRSKWNGIKLYSNDLQIINMKQYGTRKFIDVQGNNSNIIFKNCEMTGDRVLQNLVFADNVNGNISVAIHNTSVTTRSQVIYIKSNDTSHVFVDMVDSYISSRSYVVELSEVTTHKETRLVGLNILNCSLYVSALGYRIFSLSSCSSHLNGTIKGSSMYPRYYTEGVYFNFPSMNVDIRENTFRDTKIMLKFEFCRQQKDSLETYPKFINISKNTFNSSTSGTDIFINKRYTDEKSHKIYVTGNVFGYKSANRKRLYADRYDYSSRYTSNEKHSLVVGSNVFVNSTDVTIYIKNIFKKVIIKNNTFMNNSKCIHITNPWTLSEFNVTENRFINNTLTDGVIFLEDVSNNNAFIMDNSFINNTNTVIAFRSPNTTIKYNFFENEKDVYNLKVLSTEHPDKIMNASLNFWGTKDAKEISKTIYDKDYVDTLFDIEFKPYLGSKNKSDIQNENVTFVSQNSEIGGTVNGVVTLTYVKSPYQVISNVKVEATDILNIEPGVVLIIKASVGFKVYGEINILGAEGNPVMMLSENVGKPWQGIDLRDTKKSSILYLYLNDTEEGIRIRNSSVSIHNITSNFARQSGISINVSLDKKEHVKVSEVTVENNGMDGIIIYDGIPANMTEITVESCIVANNSRHGINVETDVTLHFEKCMIKKNKKSGIRLMQSEGGIVTVNESIVTENTEYAISGQISGRFFLTSSNITHHMRLYYDRWGYLRTDSYIVLTGPRYTKKELYIKFYKVNFIENLADGIYISDNYFGKNHMNIDIQNCTFSGGNRTLDFSDVGYRRSTNRVNFTFINNVIYDNIVTSRQEIMKMVFNINFRTNIHGNFFKNNIAITGLFISVSTTYVNGNVTITENNFDENNFSMSTIDIAKQLHLRLYKNIFKPVKGYDCILIAPSLDISYNINATFNYWGSNSGRQVAKSICGFEKDMAKSFVWYIPFYDDMNLDRTVSAEPNAWNFSGTFGGEITGDVTISRKDFPSPIRVERSILIRNDSSLHIEAGIVLQFEPNRGIYVQGTLNLLGGDSAIVLENAQEMTSWYGVIVNTSSENSKTIIYNARFYKMENGAILHTKNVELKKSHIFHSSSNCLTINQEMELNSFDFEMSRLDNCSKFGIYVNGNGEMSLKNIAIMRSQFGIGLYAQRGSVEISRVNISESNEEALTITFTDYYLSGNISVDNCIILNCSKGIKVTAHAWGGKHFIDIARNTFVNISSKALYILPYRYNRKGVNRTITVSYNTFTNSCGISLDTRNNVNMTLADNIFHDAICSDGQSCFLHAMTRGYIMANRYRKFHISTNVFQNITCKCLVKLDDGDNHDTTGEFVYNQLLDITAEDTVILSNAWNINMSRNIFDNPQSTFDLYAQKRGQERINATNNWWGSSDANQVYSRIFDRRRDAYLVLFDVTPVMSERVIDCTGVNNCSSQGKCVSPNRCRCYSGWAGKECTEYDCSGVNYCYGNGDCTGPNKCRCNEGWSGPLCIIASCGLVNSCSGNGICFQPNVCTCAARFTGNDCSSCVPLHWGSQCEPCPDCQHGSCNLTSGVCECEDESWTGYLCDKCGETFYGPQCLPLMKVLDIVPNSGKDRGGDLVHVWGHNFPNSSTGNYYCKFGTTRTNGTWLAWNHVVCPSPKMAEGLVYLEISTDGKEFTNDKLMYYFYASCPPGSCGREDNPPRGQCLYGGCSCFLPYTRDNCERQLLSPILFRSALDVTLVEGTSYSVQLNLTQGSQPVLWSLVRGPLSMIIDDNTGLVKWRYANANSNVYSVTVKALNLIGEDTITWNINVPLSYTVFIEHLEPNGDILLVPKPVVIYGKILFTRDDVIRVVSIDISVISERTGRETVIQEHSNPLLPSTFKTTYYPKPDDAGVFNVRARHPGASYYTSSNVTWSVSGMRCEPSSVSVNEKIISDDGIVIVKNISSLRNIGKGSIKGISAMIDGLPEAYARKSGDTESSQFELSSLGEAEQIYFDLIIKNARPLTGTVYIIFNTAAGTSTRLRIYIKLSIRKPLLIFDPPSLRENIVRGSIRVFDIKVNNTGEVTGTDVIVSLPKDPRLSLVSLSSSSTDGTSSPSNVSVPPGGIAQISIAITTSKTEALGEMRGTIYINTALSSSPFSYKFFITSLQTFNVTFTVKDEYTYFAAGSPLVSNAMVRLVNPRRGFSGTKYTTNETGYVTFENVFEDQYSLYAEAEGHSKYAEVILVTSDTTDQDIFLQRVAVKYTWSVEPTTVQDVYIIQLESTFETNIPMPVVTIEPAKVNTIPLELEEKDTIDFNITNHGLIRADNVRFSLPTSHPYLKFETTVDFIGSVEANTSIIVQVKAKLKNRVKRNAAALAICGLALLYDYVCGGTQTRNLDVTLTREYPGRPPLPCGLIGGGGGVYYGGGGTRSGSGSSVTYNPTTPLSCDCVKTLIKSCALAFHPVTGCAFAEADLGTAYSRSDGDLIIGTLKFILGLADTAMACVLGLKYTFWGLFYTTTRCAIDAYYNCNGDRKRREISSDVVDNLISTAEPIDNFLTMMTEILGDKEMYNFDSSVWYQTFKKSVGEDSDMGTMLSNNERANVLNTLVDEVAKTNLSQFLDRWNNTAAAWENGTLNELSDTSRVISLTRLTPRIEQYLNDKESAANRGFDTIFDEYGQAINAYKTAEQNQASSGGSSQKDDGVCARVRVRIIQELVLTRDAFNAKLEIENGENSDLESIKVEIHIKETFGSGELANDRFSIGTPSLIGISGVDGTGTLGKDLSGSAEWLIIPYNNAAPEDETQYDIGGRLSYSVGGSEFSVPLLPDTIDVKSNPSLVVHYFHEKYVQGDDALTPEKEPSVPFSLAVMVMNNGYGVARALKITSGQPEIIENEKGLLVSFKIVGAQIGNDKIFPSLAVNFGDIASFQTKTARWLMTSTLMGTFYNYSASFENINPLGDPQLSLMDELGYHELVHLVRIDIPRHDDGIDDFLVNDIIDDEGIPDKLYDSGNGSNIQNVSTAEVTKMNVSSFTSTKSYKIVTLTVKTNISGWFYARIENTFTSPEPNMQEFLLRAHLYNNKKELLVGKNVWQTTHISKSFYLHLLDYMNNNSSDGSSSEIKTDYVLIYGPRNMYAPRFNSTGYSVTISKSQEVGSEIITIYAYDIDRDKVEFRFRKDNIETYDIMSKSEMSATIRVKVSPFMTGTVMLEVIAKDSGIPSRYAYVNVSVTITDTTATKTTTPTSVTNVSMSVTTTEPSTIFNGTSETVSRRSTLFSTTMLNKSTMVSTPSISTTKTTLSTSPSRSTTKTTLSTLPSVSTTKTSLSNVSQIFTTTSPSTTFNTTKLTTTGIKSTTEGVSEVTTVSSSFKVQAEIHLMLLMFFFKLVT